MSLSSFGALLAIWVAAIVSPGPDIVQITRMGARSRRAGVWCAVGIMTGNALWIIASLAGLSALITAYPAILGWLQLLGGSYLGFLGWKALRGGLAARGSSGSGPLEEAGAVTGRLSDAAAWRGGLATNLANPKAVVFFGAVFAQFICPDMGMQWAVLVAVALIVVGLAWFVGFALAVQALSARIARGAATIDIVTGGVFLLLAAFMVVEGLRTLL
ncbi:LysE family translocator [Corynebacterium lowii]|uniref:Threonine efflux protein n=1 Tax=Corynebacterium lowii TaxID=1544413 RepID=A0A0Q1AJT4_9CORY|nr:LysE family translocator [Corynebacterium lowii]KQB87133.1 Threonine efflux protein [Corynebacterium lowii]MDP9852281.1 threonine/homoserine/homoserine lactone efflux protein [Corynebacterium lowii]